MAAVARRPLRTDSWSSVQRSAARRLSCSASRRSRDAISSAPAGSTSPVCARPRSADGVARAIRRRFAGRFEPLHRVLANRLQQAIAGHDVGGVDQRHRLVDQAGRAAPARRRARCPSPGQTSRPSPASSRRRRPTGAAAASARARRAGRGSSRSWREWCDAAGSPVRTARPSVAGVVLQPIGELLDGQHLRARGGQLERQRNAVHADADARDRGRIVVAQDERVVDRVGALDEQADRGAAA